MGANLTVEGGISLDMIKMNKLLEYDPTSLTMTVQAGMRLIDIEKFLANKPFSYMPAQRCTGLQLVVTLTPMLVA